MNRIRTDYPAVNRIDANGVQWIELNRGCLRQCVFCHADPNYKTFPIPEIFANVVQIIGEGFLYDPMVDEKIKQLSTIKYCGKVVRYGLSQGIDFRLLTKEIAGLLHMARIGIINNKGNWSNGIRFAWDLGMEHKELAQNTIKILVDSGYRRECIQVFILTNWKISYETCLKKLKLIKSMGVKVDDCTFDTTKKEMKPIFWERWQLVSFRRMARKHNQLINFRGFDPQPAKILSCGELW